jgi:hypothetical protein
MGPSMFEYGTGKCILVPVLPRYVKPWVSTDDAPA